MAQNVTQYRHVYKSQTMSGPPVVLLKRQCQMPFAGHETSRLKNAGSSPCNVPPKVQQSDTSCIGLREKLNVRSYGRTDGRTPNGEITKTKFFASITGLTMTLPLQCNAVGHFRINACLLFKASPSATFL